MPTICPIIEGALEQLLEELDGFETEEMSELAQCTVEEGDVSARAFHALEFLYGKVLKQHLQLCLPEEVGSENSLLSALAEKQERTQEGLLKLNCILNDLERRLRTRSITTKLKGKRTDASMQRADMQEYSLRIFPILREGTQCLHAYLEDPTKDVYLIGECLCRCMLLAGYTSLALEEELRTISNIKGNK